MQSATGFVDIALMVLGINHDKIDALANEFKERAITAGTAKMNFLRGGFLMACITGRDTQSSPNKLDALPPLS